MPFQKNPYSPHGRSSEIPRGRGIFKAKILEAKYEAKLEFSGGRGSAKQKNVHGGSMDIFWNCTLEFAAADVSSSFSPLLLTVNFTAKATKFLK